MVNQGDAKLPIPVISSQLKLTNPLLPKIPYLFLISVLAPLSLLTSPLLPCHPALLPSNIAQKSAYVVADLQIALAPSPFLFIRSLIRLLCSPNKINFCLSRIVSGLLALFFRSLGSTSLGLSSLYDIKGEVVYKEVWYFRYF